MKADLIFFGQDLNGSSTVRVAHPNSDAASAAFLADLTGTGTETFESFAANQAAPLNLTFPGAGTATLTGTGTVTNVPSGTNGAGRYPISGNQYFDTDSNLTVTFNNPGGVAAFGFYGIDVGDVQGQLTLTLHLAAGGTITKTVNNNTTTAANGAVLFYGIIDTANPFTSVTFGDSAAGSDFFGFDNMTVGSVQQVVPAVPEPSSILLFGTVLLGVCAALRKQRTA